MGVEEFFGMPDLPETSVLKTNADVVSHIAEAIANTTDIELSKALFEILNKLKLVRKRTINTFLKTNYTIKNYSNNELLREAKLFSEWYMPKIIKKKLSLSKKLYINIIKKLILSLMLKKKFLFIEIFTFQI